MYYCNTTEKEEILQYLCTTVLCQKAQGCCITVHVYHTCTCMVHFYYHGWHFKCYDKICVWAMNRNIFFAPCIPHIANAVFKQAMNVG